MTQLVVPSLASGEYLQMQPSGLGGLRRLPWEGVSFIHRSGRRQGPRSLAWPRHFFHSWGEGRGVFIWVWPGRANRGLPRGVSCPPCGTESS